MKPTWKKAGARDGQGMSLDSISYALDPAMPEASSGLFSSTSQPPRFVCL